ncbi:MAG: ExbD/TolR family protein [Akkermansiaceae bacterium]
MRILLRSISLTILLLSGQGLHAEAMASTLHLKGETWHNFGAPKNSQQPYIDPASTTLKLQYPAGKQVVIFQKIFPLALHSKIAEIQLIETAENKDTPATITKFLLADPVDLLENAEQHGAADPAMMGVEHFVAITEQKLSSMDNHVCGKDFKTPYTSKSLIEQFTKQHANILKHEPDTKQQALLVTTTTLSCAEMTKVIRALGTSGIKRLLPLVNSQMALAMSSEVIQDPNVEPAVAKRAAQNSRLVIHMSLTGEISHKNKQITHTELVVICKKFITQQPTGVLHLRAAKKTPFQHIRVVTRIANKAGIKNVVFSSPRPSRLKPMVEKTIKPREKDLPMTLPAGKKNGKAPALAPLFIQVSKQGTVSVNQGKAKEVLDTDPTKRALPLLTKRLKLYTAAAKAGGHAPAVKIWADPEAEQLRVIDVINALAASKISSVTFTDDLDE